MLSECIVEEMYRCKELEDRLLKVYSLEGANIEI